MFEKFIADRMQKGSGRYSKPIVSIAILGIILGVMVMIISASIVRGFRTEIRDKVVGFNAHLEITDLASGEGTIDERVRIDETFVAHVAALDEVESIKPFIARPCILESPEGIEGVVSRGLLLSDSSSFLRERIVEGRMIALDQKKASKELMISAATARSLDVKLGDKLSLYYITEGTDFSTRRLEVTGIYQTDLEEFDKQFIYIDQRHLQKLSGWGLEIQVLVEDSCSSEGWNIKALAFGGSGKYHYRWSNGQVGKGPYRICPDSEEPLEIILLDSDETLADTARVHFVSNEPDSDCDCPYRVDTVLTTGGSAKYYVGGFEVMLKDFGDLASSKAEIREVIKENSWNKETEQRSSFFFTRDIIERTPEIFSWLEILDVNIYIIITLMIGVAVFNMSSALLILIIERSNMIGILKALGSGDWSVRKIFIHHSGKLILKGLFWGNVIGLGLALAQKHFQLIKLTAETYYLNHVPILIDWKDILMIDLGTLAICLLAMLIPSYFITRITPVEAIRFD